ncbi:lipoprotein-releasing ABC transporter permease subunit [uncultured Desulfovibrio sp.]|uniref:lipoprotein-releasing ABC transporter permease subunit n=1 Tax=uncultured Desulfovibrio sp. TaxID=167968 RepID=UPI001B06783B|nr:lipoprotein-releasing ABC transporter permease subunit [uncultured Desulfovibrio sp.]MBO5490885.1 lipoprotein-releasing ABC transporter permease subunit [Desulfovibrio sp.]
MRFELFVALRYLFSRRKQTFIYIISIMSILGVALGVGALVVVLGVYNGLTTDMRDKILGANAHAIVMSHLPSAFETRGNVTEQARSVAGVTGATPFIYTEVMLSAGGGVKGVVLRGIDPQSAPAVLSMLRQIRSGSAEGLQREGTPGIIIGEELAKRLGLALGSRVNLLSPSGQKTASGYAPRIRPFEVVGIFKTGMFEYDSSLAFVTLAAARDVLGLPENFISGVELTVADLFQADKTSAAVAAELGSPFYVRSWMEMNANLFAALKLEKIGMFILLAMVVLIGSFSIVTTLVMLVMEKTRDIAIMMSMGATSGMIRRIFMLQGSIIGVIGTLLGYALGLSLGWLLKRYQFIKLPENVYTLDHLPISITLADVLIVGASAMLLCFLATLYPARQASRLQPAEALRYE